jgi:large subunit ribosomal protein L25
MEKIALELEKREVVGKHTRKLRTAGVTPAHLFGHGVASLALEGTTTEVERAIAKAGTSHLINLRVKGEKRSRNVLIREIQRKPVTGLLLHVDFYQVRSTEKMTVEVPVHLVGVAPAVEGRVGTVAVEIPVLEVECLPADLPARIDVDITKLKAASDVVRVGDVRAPEGVTILNDRELAVVKIEVERKAPAPTGEIEAAAEAAPKAEKAEKPEKPDRAQGRPAA